MLSRLLKAFAPKSNAAEPSPAGRAAPAPAPAPAAPAPVPKGIPSEKIAARAYEIWCERGRPTGSDLENWLQAERELTELYHRPGGAGRR
jgi:hypothetical protein